MEPMNPNYTDTIIPDNFQEEMVGAATAEAPFDYNTLLLIERYFRMISTGSISVFGVVSNVINIIVFYRQGPMSHSCTVSLFGLAVSDLCFCINIIFGSVLLAIYHFDDHSKYNWNVIAFHEVYSVRSEIVFSGITCWMTVFIAFERFFSVVFPFKVKRIFTPKLACCVLAVIVTSACIFNLPNSMLYLPVWVKYGNKSFLSFKYNPNSRALTLAYTYSRVTSIIASVLIIIVCNVTTTLTVKMSTKFKKSTTSSVTQQTVHPSSQDSNGDEPTNSTKTVTAKTDGSYSGKKEMMLVRMITILCALFCVCYIFDVVYNIFVSSLSGLVKGVDYHWHTDYTLVMVKTFFQTINSSCNIIIYYLMSTQYRKEFQLCLCISNRKK